MPIRPLIPAFRRPARFRRSRASLLVTGVCPPVQTLSRDVVSVSTSCGVYSPYSAQVQLVNNNTQYTTDLVWDIFQFTLNTSAQAQTIDPTCFQGNVQWVNGVVASFDQTEELAASYVNLEIVSYFSRLSGKPVTTELYNVMSAATVLTELAQLYGTVPASFCSFAGMTANKISGTVTGNSLLEEMQKVAQVGLCNLFVQRSGVLTAGAWKDADSSVDVVIPDEAIVSASNIKNDGIGPSRIKIRGRYISQVECGSQYLMVPVVPGQQGAGYVYFCVITAVPQPKTKVKFSVTTGPNWTYKNSDITVINGKGETVKIQEDGKSTGAVTEMTLELESSDDNSYYTSSASQVGVRVTGQNRAPQEFDIPAHIGRYGKASKGQTEDITFNFTRSLAQTSGNTTRRGGGARNQDDNYSADERDPVRLEMDVVDPDLQAEFGIVVEQLDNPYISDYGTAFDIAIRRFQEFKMQRNAWRVSMVYLPCVQLNQVVTFTPPGRSESVTGVVTNIAFSYDNTPKASMEIIVESLEELGTTNYVSQSLVSCVDLISMSTTDPNKVVLVNGTILVTADAGETEFGEITLATVPGMTYKLDVSVVKISGSGTFTMSIFGGQAISPTSTGTYSFDDYVAGSSVIIQFEAAAGGTNLQWQVANIDWKIKKTA